MHSGIDGRGSGGCVALRMVHYVFSLRHNLRTDEKGLQVLDVRASKFQCIDLGQFSRGRVSRHELTQLIECGVDRVHPLPLTFVGCRPLAGVLLYLDVGLCVFIAAFVGAGASAAPAGASIVGRMTVLATFASTLAIRFLRGRLRVVVVIIDVGVDAREAALSLRAWGREALGGVT